MTRAFSTRLSGIYLHVAVWRNVDFVYAAGIRMHDCAEGGCIATANENVPIQLAQCRFPRLAISSAKILIHFHIKYTVKSSFIKQHTKTVIV